MSFLQVKCPMCKGMLWIDRTSGKVVDHKAADQKKVDFDSFMKARSEQSSKWEEKMKKAKENEAKRKSELDAQFRKAAEDPDQIEGDYESPFKWD